MVSLSAVETVLARLCSQESSTCATDDTCAARVDALLNSWRPFDLDAPLRDSPERLGAGSDSAVPLRARATLPDIDVDALSEEGFIPMGSDEHEDDASSQSSSSSRVGAGTRRVSFARSEASTTASPSRIHGLTVIGLEAETADARPTRHAVNRDALQSRQRHRVVKEAGAQPEAYSGMLLLHGPSDWIPGEAQSFPSYARQRLLSDGKYAEPVSRQRRHAATPASVKGHSGFHPRSFSTGLSGRSLQRGIACVR
eukprot:TRINITY_DN53111_c0_g1_i1.p1 TRINITY_DN53111_c0_g1~~TRINITY_DN53111_c0_g1_i1.p1  ORF type:complete len:255 (-),score=35.12 TRINITY_DN53111_c0_g1_i1:10-774(-)